MFTLEELLVNADPIWLRDRKKKKDLKGIILSPIKAKTVITVRLLVTPELASYWLENYNVHNRPLSDYAWMTIGIDILDKRWRYNGDAIRFGTNGSLLDGQTRLKACAETKTSIDTQVIFGLEPAAQDVMDINRVRTPGNIAHLHDVQNANQACAIESMLLTHERSGIGKSLFPVATITRNNGKIKMTWNRPTKTEIVSGVRKRPHLQERIKDMNEWRRGRLIPPRIIGFCHYLFSEQNHELSMKFFNEVLLAENLKPHTVTHWLHTRLVENRSSKHRLLHREMIALVFKAWIAYRDGSSVKVLRWSRGQGEEFPDISIAAN